MSTRIWLFVSLLLTTPAFGAQAQAESEDVRVLRSAAFFVRDSLVKTKVFFDQSLFRRGRSISDTTADLVARHVGAERARLDDLVLCDGKPRGPWCRLKGDVAVVAFGELRIRGDAATVVAYFIHPVTARPNGRRELVTDEELLTLTRLTNGSWRVTETKTLSIS